MAKYLKSKEDIYKGIDKIAKNLTLKDLIDYMESDTMTYKDKVYVVVAHNQISGKIIGVYKSLKKAKLIRQEYKESTGFLAFINEFEVE